MAEEKIPMEEDGEKKNWQQKKEGWYDKIPLNLRQLDNIIVVCWILIAVTILLIYLDAKDIFHLFG